LPKRTYHAPIPDLQKEAIPSKEDVKKALSYCNTKYQAIILLMSSSGISLGDVLNLKISDFLNAINIPQKQHHINKLNNITVNDFCKDMVPIWHIQRIKSDTFHITFNTPETTRKILDYLNEHPPKNVDDTLFRGKTGKGLRSDVFQRFLRKLNIECEWGYIGRLSSFIAIFSGKSSRINWKNQEYPIITYANSWDIEKTHLLEHTFPLPVKS